MSDVIRVWKECDITEMEKHLLIVGDSLGDCASCKEVGLDYSTVTACPHCHTTFTYASVRTATGTGDHRFHEVKRVLNKRKDLIVIDYDDYKRISGRHKAKNIFND